MEAMKTAQKAPPQKSMMFFKLFCYVHPENVPNDSLEASFLFEQVNVWQPVHLHANKTGYFSFAGK